MTGAEGPSVRGRWPQVLLLIFCLGHAAFLIFSIIPPKLSHRFVSGPVLNLYELLFAGRQQWIMFDTIPVHRSMTVRLERFGPDGTKEVAGALLPGLRPYPQPEDVRYQGLFYRVLFSAEEIAMRDAYLRNASRALATRPNSGASGPWSVVVEAEYTRNLSLIRRDKNMAVPVVKSFPLPPPPEEAH